MDLEVVMQSEISQMEKDKYCMISLICGIFFKKINEQIEQKQTHRYREQIGGYQRGRGGGGRVK